MIEAGNDRDRAAMVRLRNRLLGEHCGASADDVAELLEDMHSLTLVADVLSRNGHVLRPIDDRNPDVTEKSLH